MKMTARNAIFTIAAFAILFFAFLAFMIFAFALVATLTALSSCFGIAALVKNLRINRFNHERRTAMDAAEALSCSLEWYEKELPFSYYSRFQFRRALDNAHKVGLSLREWISLVHQHLDRNANLNNGLQLKDVPAFVEDVSRQVREAYIYIKDGSKGAAPKILDPFWFDESSVCGDDVRLFPVTHGNRLTRQQRVDQFRQMAMVYPKLRAIASSTPPKTVEHASTANESEQIPHADMNQAVVNQTVMYQTAASEPVDEASSPKEDDNAAAPTKQMLTTLTSNDLVCPATQLEIRRQSRDQHRVRDVVTSEVLVFDTSKRKAKS